MSEQLHPEQSDSDDLEMAVSIANRDSRRYRLLREAILDHLDTFGNHEDLMAALAEAEGYRS